MECKLNHLTIHYQVFGEGKPILLLHGAPPDHRALLGCMEPIFNNRAGCRWNWDDALCTEELPPCG
jgi:pimeloyl-ACP methyl ester carboxylesterase